MAIEEIYIDPSIAADTGSGSLADPYGDLEHAIISHTFNVTDGLRCNIREGTDEVLAANLYTATQDTSVSIAWATSNTAAPLIFQGYTSAAGDGGIGGISGGGAVPVWSDTAFDNVHFRDLHLHTCGANDIIKTDDRCSVINCEVNGTTLTAINCGSYSNVFGNYIHDFATNGATATTATVMANYIDGSSMDGSGDECIYVSTGALAMRNICIVAVNGNGITTVNGGQVHSNSIYATGAAVHRGIWQSQTTVDSCIANNLIEGFSGSGGTAITAIGQQSAIHGNSYYDCETNESFSNYIESYGGNEALTESPFTDAAGGDFSPVNTGAVKEGSLPEDFANGAI